MDITQLILDDHHEQRRLFAILEQIDRTDTVALSALWTRLAAFLELHAEAEEELFYPELLRVGAGAGGVDTPEAETEDAISDHNDIRDAVAAVGGHEIGSDDWYDAVAKANEANSDHMAEEEREGLTDFRRHAGLQLRHDLAVAFAAFEATHFAGVTAVDKDPESYVREVEEEIAASNDRGDDRGDKSEGSLGIGGLKGG
ncbi:MAG: hemerythrin domain-containing protein [Actinomycetota bacterium]|nr:hemerythrin domain-containing protein [Actinomycetota bacterium]